MAAIYYTVSALALYITADFLLNYLERRRGARYAERDLVFFVLLAVLAITTFALIRRLTTVA